MTSAGPKSADLIAAEPATALPWELVRDVLADTRMYWLASMHPAGRPHVRPVLAVWHDAAPYTTSAAPGSCPGKPASTRGRPNGPGLLPA